MSFGIYHRANVEEESVAAYCTVFGKTPNYLHNESPYIREQLDKLSQPGRRASDYAIGYMWGTAGLLYNTDHVPAEDAKTWASLWNLKYKNKILMKESYRDAYGTALIYANSKNLKEGKVTVEELMNNYSQASVDTVEKYLKAMKPMIAGWEADFGKEMMTKNKAWLNMTWSGDAVWAIEEAGAVGVNLDYEVPEEGSNVWYDGWVIPKYARNVKAASYFINYLCRPEVALRNMDACGYVSSVATPEILEEKLDTTLNYYADLSYFFGPEADSVRIDKVRYPDRRVVERCAMIRDSGERTEAVLEMWSRVKGDNLGLGIVVVIFVSVGDGMWFIRFIGGYSVISTRNCNAAAGDTEKEDNPFSLLVTLRTYGFIKNSRGLPCSRKPLFLSIFYLLKLDNILV